MIAHVAGVGSPRARHPRTPWLAAAATPAPSAVGITEVPVDFLALVAVLLVLGMVLAASIVLRRLASDRPGVDGRGNDRG